MSLHGRHSSCASRMGLVALLAVLVSIWTPALADETCNSPYMASLIKSQEDYVYVWTLGVKGVGDGSDKLVTIDANPSSPHYGKVIHKVSVGGRGEAHHMGFTDDRRFLWAGGLDDSKIFVFDVGGDPAKPRLVKRITDMSKRTGYLGPTPSTRCPGGCWCRRCPTARTRAGRPAWRSTATRAS